MGMETAADKGIRASNTINLDENFISFIQRNSHHFRSLEEVIVISVQEQVPNGISVPSDQQVEPMVAGRGRD
jgi:hypothetical protein